MYDLQLSHIKLKQIFHVSFSNMNYVKVILENVNKLISTESLAPVKRSNNSENSPT